MFKRKEYVGQGSFLNEIQSLIIGGRRFYNERRAPYMLPKDTQEINRLDFQHYLLRQVMRGNYLAPIGDNPHNILDVGCGTGQWGIEMAQKFPKAQVIGLDLEEARQKKYTKNYLFQQGNLLNGMPYGRDSFDFVHQRLMVMSIPTYKWPQAIRELLRVTRPDGWIELVETGTVFPNGPYTRELYKYVGILGKRAGIDLNAIPQLADIAHKAGMRAIKEYHMDIPLGAWAGRIGRMGEQNVQCLYDAVRGRLIDECGLSAEKVNALWPQLEVEWNNKQARQRFYIICGQK